MANQSAASLHLLIFCALSQQQPPTTVHYWCSTAKLVRNVRLRSLCCVSEGAGSEGSRRQIVAVRTPHSCLVATHSHDPTRTLIRCIHQPYLHRLARRVIFTIWNGTRLNIHVLRTTVSVVSMLSETSTLDGTELIPQIFDLRLWCDIPTQVAYSLQQLVGEIKKISCLYILLQEASICLPLSLGCL
jgi:hypothetical protein